MARRKPKGFTTRVRTQGPANHSSSVGKAKMVWRNPRRKPRSRARKGWGK